MFISFKVISGTNSIIIRRRQSKNQGALQLMVGNISVRFGTFTLISFRVMRDTKFISLKVIRGNNSIIVRGRQSKNPRCTTTHGGDHFCEVWWLCLNWFQSYARHKFCDRRTDRQTDRRTDRQTDNSGKNNMSPQNGGRHNESYDGHMQIPNFDLIP